MTMAPVEVIVVAFPGSAFNGAILPELRRLVDTSTITIVDGLFVRRDEAGELVWSELAEIDAELGGLLERVEGLISDEDAAELAADLQPGSSAAVLAFEHSWMRPLREAVAGSGGVLVADIQVPGGVVEEILATVPDEEEQA
ncbi:MAG: hypothetical protein IT193_08875 [Propionibacteriaceae bacterium]|nr:hypothetical protein [Propionibacteriaceae bacterium]